MKKLFALVLTLAMVLSLAACGGKDKAPAEEGGVIKTVNLWATGSDNVREIFEALTEKFKNDPVKLAVLSKLAQELNDVE